MQATLRVPGATCICELALPDNCNCASRCAPRVACLREQRNIAVELWDVSGDRQYEGGWPAIMHGAVGIVYVYDACKVGEEKDLEQWHKWFGQTIGLKDGQLLVMAHKKEDKKTHRGSLPKSLSNAHVVSTTLEDNQTIIKENFDRFLDEAAKAARQRQKEEEDKLSA